MPEVEWSTFSCPLLLDASCPRVQVGIPAVSSWLSFQSSREQALTSLFTGFRRCIDEVGRQAREIDAILFCEGPGSTLGLRIAITLVKTLGGQITPKPPLFAYNALEVASMLASLPNAPIIADYRQGQWYLRETSGDIRVIDEAEAIEVAPSSQPLRQRKSWKQLPETGPEVDYDLSRLAGLNAMSPFLRPVDAPNLFDPRPATFRKWGESQKEKK